MRSARRWPASTSPHVVVFRSTVVPGTVEDVLRPIIEAESGGKDGTDFHLCFQPEFLREGSSIRDYDKPPFTIVGANHDFPVDRLRDLFGHLDCKFIRTSVRSAEMMKYCCNNFHALKITFANETARLCDALGVDPFEVMDLVCQDTQLNISRAYLKPGFAFGGSCLPKDLRATAHLARSHDVELPMLGNILASNQAHLALALRKILATGKRRIGFIGLSFKSGTDDLRESPLGRAGRAVDRQGYAADGLRPRSTPGPVAGREPPLHRVAHAPYRPAAETTRSTRSSPSPKCSSSACRPPMYARRYAQCHRDQSVIDLVQAIDRTETVAVVHGLCW